MSGRLLQVAIYGFAGVMLLAAAGVSADQYSWEVSGNWSRASLSGASDSVTNTSVAATHYFAPVDDTGGPYGYAAFLSRSSRVSASTRRETAESTFIGSSPPTPLTDRTDAYSVTGRHVWRDSGWYVGGMAQRESTDPSQPLLDGFTNYTLNGYSAFGGKYLGRSTTLDLTLESSEGKTDVQPIVCVSAPCGGPVASKTSIDDIGVSVQHLGKLAAMRYAVAGRVARSHEEIRIPGFGNFVAFSQRTRTYAVSGELLPTMRVGVGVDYSSFSDDPALRDHAYGLSASWFFKRNLALEFSGLRTNFRGVSRSDDDWSVGLLGRF